MILSRPRLRLSSSGNRTVKEPGDIIPSLRRDLQRQRSPMKNPFWAKASLCASLLVLSVGNCWAGLAGYGVIIGKPVGHSLYTGGQWPHYHISVQPAGGPLYDSALDLFSPSQAVATEVA